MTDLLGADSLDQIAVRLGRSPTKVHGLEQILHHRAHLAELSTEALLEGVRGGRIGLVGGNVVNE